VIPPKPEEEKPRMIPILNFGPDHDIELTKNNLADAEQQHGHKFQIAEPEKPIP